MVNTSNNTSSLNWKIFPKPTKDYLTIEGISEGITKISLVDNLGRKIYTLENKQAGLVEEHIDISTLEKGIYFLEISNPENQLTKKIVKQ